MAEWLFGTCIVILLCIISAQLRGLRKQLAAMHPQSETVHAEADLSFAAWLEELESKGSEILTRLENERRAVEQTLRQQVVQPVVYETLRAPVQGGTATVPEVGAAPEAQPVHKPLNLDEEADQVQVHNWVRIQPPGSERGTQRAKSRGQRQNWTETQRKVHDLLQRGVSVTAIAKTLGLSQGEVQLIVSKLAASQRAV